jgi:CelD/BcsL family acetyltransferase involved in cellulose biosynthesis
MAATTISVTIARAAPQLGGAWRDLVSRAAPNVFLDPDILGAVEETDFAETIALAAHADDKLVGFWALELLKTTPLGPTILSAPAYDYAFVSSPILDPGYADETMAAFFRAIANEPSLPQVMRLRYLDGEYESFRALSVASAANPHLTLSTRERAFATREQGVKKSGSTRKKLRQMWKRLAGEGEVTLDNRRDMRTAIDTFEAFLTMEQRSWKGDHGTALLSREKDARFARQTFANLARAGNASVACLRVNDRAIAMQVLLYCGATAYAWKTAYDQAWERFSPGTLLIDRISEELLSGDFDAIESCSPDSSFTSTLWEGRRKTVDMIIDLGTHASPTFALVATGVRAYAGAKILRNRVRAAIGQHKPDSRAAA